MRAKIDTDLHLRQQFIDGLRAVADFYEAHPAAYYDGTDTTLTMYLWGQSARETLAAAVKAFGECTKTYDESHLIVSKHFSEKVKVELFTSRSKVCRKVVVGTRIEPACVIPAVKETRIPEREVEILEWQCDPLLIQEP